MDQAIAGNLRDGQRDWTYLLQDRNVVVERRRFISQMGIVGTCLLTGSGWPSESATRDGIHSNGKSPGGKSTNALTRVTADDSLVTRHRTGKALGTMVSMVVRHPSEQRARAALDAAFAELERVEQLLSMYRESSQLSQLNREKFVHNADPSLVEVLQISQRVARHSQGAFDVTVQPLWALYDIAARDGKLPVRHDIDRCLSGVDWRQIELAENRVRLHGPDTQITLNGIAQGYAADRVMWTLRRHGIVHALIDTGELSGQGTNREEAPWQVGIQHPRIPDAYVAITRLNGRSLATSGDYESEFVDDFSAHHILDPRQGTSPRELSSVSVLADTATMADALSTTLMVLGREAGMKLLRRFQGVDALLIDKQGRTQATSGFPFVHS
jgi:thiamine biosynthesis lipoprotein